MNDAPKRIMTPDKYMYILLSKKKFVELIADIQAAIEKNLAEAGAESPKIKINISVDGFEGFFKTAEELTGTLTPKEWTSLKSILVYFYDNVGKEYEQRLSLKFAKGYLSGPGLEISYGKKNTGPLRHAIKASIEVFIEGYIRKVPFILQQRAMEIFIPLIIFISGNLLILGTAKQEVLRSIPIGTYINLEVILVGAAFIIGYIPTIILYPKILPYFETIEDTTKSRWQVLLKIIGILVLAVGFIGSVLGIIQFFSGK